MLSQHSFSLLKYRFGLWLFESVFLHQFAQLAVGDAGLVGLIVDGDECNVGTIALDKHGVKVAGEVRRGVNLTVH